jgi:hypothetical protein
MRYAKTSSAGSLDVVPAKNSVLSLSTVTVMHDTELAKLASLFTSVTEGCYIFGGSINR